jgi:hypothetical protein
MLWLALLIWWKTSRVTAAKTAESQIQLREGSDDPKIGMDRMIG